MYGDSRAAASGWALFVALATAGLLASESPKANQKGSTGPKAACQTSAAAKTKWMSLFDGKTLKGWKVTDFGGQGEVKVQDGQLILEMGADLTGITWTQPEKLPKINYEVSLDAMRVDGTDFFCGLTFPVKDSPCTLIVGGWGGGLCGLSSLDGMDASENETTTFKDFKNGRWYHIRLRVTEKRIQAWIDNEKIIDVDITDRKISVRIEVELSRPFGIATWQTTAALKNIRIRRLTPEEVAATERSSS